MMQLRDYQEESVAKVGELLPEVKRLLLVLCTGAGKCLGANTPVLMYDGTIKAVQDIMVGDKLMGPDSQPRNVLSLARGREMMYTVTPTKGAQYRVNESHILSLRLTGNKGATRCANGVPYKPGDICNISIRDYLTSNKTFKHCAKGWRTGVDFDEQRHSRYLPPYLLGLWLGDGNSRVPEITTGDKEIYEYIKQFAENTGQKWTHKEQKGNCDSIAIRGVKYQGRGQTEYAYTHYALKRLNLYQNKHIPHEYLCASYEQRMELLAGILDSDGHNCKGRGYDVVLKQERFMDDLIYLCRSLGFAAYKTPCKKTCTNTGATGDYFRCFISGDLDRIPVRLERHKIGERKQKKNVLNIGITVEPDKVDDYYGFAIDGDHLFMLGDFTVTHNTVVMSHLIDEWTSNSKSTMLIAHRQELISQASMTLATFGVKHQLICPKPLERKIKQMHLEQFGRSFIDPFSICYVGSAQTVVRRLDKLKRPDYLLVDESAHAVSNLWKKTIEHFDTLTLGVTATPTRSDRRSLGEVFNEMYVGKDMASIIDDGQLCRYDIYSTPEEFDLSQVKRVKSGESKGDYNRQDLDKQIDKPKIVGRAVEHYEKYAKGKRAIVFAVSIKHSEHISAEFRAAGYNFISIDGGTDDAIRYKAFQDLKHHRIDGIVNVDIASEGVSVDGVEVVIMIRPISELAFGLYAQQIGRALRLFPGKERGIVIDMVGNAKRHGFVEDKTDWTLWEGEEKKKRGANDNVIKIKTCPDCFHTHRLAPSCPNCGHIYAPEAGREYEQVDGELVQLERQRELDQRRTEQNAALRQAETLEDTYRIDADLGLARGATAHKKRAIEEKKQAIARLNKALKYWKETCLHGDIWLHEELFSELFGCTEQEARKYGAVRANRLCDKMRGYVLALRERAGADYKPREFDFIALRDEIGEVVDG